MKVRGFFKHQRDWIKARDGYRCQLCHSTENLTVHHICGRHYAYHELGWDLERINGSENGITLCSNCHHNIIHLNCKAGEWNKEYDFFLKLIARINTYFYTVKNSDNSFPPVILYP